MLFLSIIVCPIQECIIQLNFDPALVLVVILKFISSAIGIYILWDNFSMFLWRTNLQTADCRMISTSPLRRPLITILGRLARVFSTYFCMLYFSRMFALVRLYEFPILCAASHLFVVQVHEGTLYVDLHVRLY